MDDETVRRLLEELQAERREMREERRQIAAIVGARGQKRTPIAELFEAYAKIRRSDGCWTAIRNKLMPLVRHLGSLPA